MRRIPPPVRENLDASGKELWDEVVAGRGPRVIARDGSMAGPFGRWLVTPGIGHHLVGLGGSLHADTTLDRRLTELATIAVTAYWRAEYPFWAHAQMARDLGFHDSVLDAIAAGDPPPLTSALEETVYDIARKVAETGTVDPALLDTASASLDQRQLSSWSSYAAGTPWSRSRSTPSRSPAPGVPHQWPADVKEHQKEEAEQ
jgi:4-carboxymuconolactone decarboxylase